MKKLLSWIYLPHWSIPLSRALLMFYQLVKWKVDGVTFRGCESDLPPNYSQMEVCSISEHCNNLIYPSDRLRCYKCSGTDCFSPYGSTRSCLNYDENDQCYTSVFDDKNTTRGCMSDGNVTMTSFLVTCDYNNCNNQVAISSLNCFKCSSNTNKDCVRDPAPEEDCKIPVVDTCTVFPLLGRNDSCYMRRTGDLVERGCSSTDFDPEELENLDESVEQCMIDRCNDECIPEAMCYTCDSRTDPNCAGNLAELQPKTCDDYGLSTCFSCLDDGIVTRGCGSTNLTEGCASCEGKKGCNNFEMRYCYSCSSEDDPNCAQLTALDRIDQKVCSSGCISKIVGQHTVRGCASGNLTCEPNEPNCATCTGELCNSEIIPSNRLRCYHCDGSTPCFNITSKNEVSLPCANYDAEDRCMAYLSKNKIIRGCLSDNSRDECIEAAQKCLTCDTNNCNGIPLLRPPQLSCIACYYLSECSWGFNKNDGRPCKGDVPFYLNETCYTFQYSDGSISRGCSLEAGCDVINPNCKICDSNNCNNENAIYQSCIQCDSETSVECVGEQVGSSATKCPGNIHLYKDRGCYAMQKDNMVTRGCVTQLSEAERQSCKSTENDECELCYDQACNTQKLSNSSTYLKASTSIVCLAAFSMIFLFLISDK